MKPSPRRLGSLRFSRSRAFARWSRWRIAVAVGGAPAFHPPPPPALRNGEYVHYYHQKTLRRFNINLGEFFSTPTNDGLAASAASIGALLPRKYIYFVPFGQDDFEKKPTSLVADFSQVADAAAAALEGRQLQPLLLRA